MSIRTERVAELVQREVATILQRDYSDQLRPMVTITHVRVTPDLSIAYIHASVMGETEEQRKATFRQLKSLTSEVRNELASRIRHQVRTIPELEFFLDESMQKAKRLNNLFDKIREEREQRGSDGAPEPTEEVE